MLLRLLPKGTSSVLFTEAAGVKIYVAAGTEFRLSHGQGCHIFVSLCSGIGTDTKLSSVGRAERFEFNRPLEGSPLSGNDHQ